jgi:hypothetical protein
LRLAFEPNRDGRFGFIEGEHTFVECRRAGTSPPTSVYVALGWTRGLAFVQRREGIDYWE